LKKDSAAPIVGALALDPPHPDRASAFNLRVTGSAPCMGASPNLPKTQTTGHSCGFALLSSQRGNSSKFAAANFSSSAAPIFDRFSYAHR